MTANESARADWNGASAQAWVADADRRDAVLSPVLDALLAAASLQPGDRVLDIGCGCGATTLAAAPEVAAITGVDLSEPMLDVARRRAAAAGIANATFVTRDAQTDDLGTDHDLAISRFGTMFFDDPVAAFTNIADALRTGGTLCIATWQALADNEWLTVPGAALLQHGDLPTTEPSAPGMFAQSAPDVITDVLGAAGFRTIDVRAVRVPLHLGADAVEATDHLSTLGLARAVLEPLDATQRTAALSAVRNALAEREHAGGVNLAAGILVTTATR